MRTFSVTCLAILAAVSTIGQAQTINTSHSKIVALTNAHDEAPNPALTKQQPMMSPVMTRAIARRDASGELVVKCHVEPSPAVRGPRGPEREATHKKVN